MVVKRINGKRRILQYKLLLNPYLATNKEFCKDNGTVTLRGIFPVRPLELLGYRKCCVCGFYEHEGIKTRSGFVCLRDFENNAMFFPEKLILPNGLHIHPSKTLENWIK